MTPPKYVVECIRDSLVGLHRGRLTQADFTIRVTKTPQLPEAWKKALVEAPTLATLNNLLGEKGGIEVDLINKKIRVDPPIIIALRTKSMAANILARNPIATPWKRDLEGDVVVASVAKTLSAVASRRIADYTIMITTDGSLERTLWALATADSLNVITQGFIYVSPRGVYRDVISAQILGSPGQVQARAIQAILAPFIKIIGRAIRHWVNLGGNLSRLVALTDLTEKMIPETDEYWYVYSVNKPKNADPQKVEEIMAKLVEEGIDVATARQIATFYLTLTSAEMYRRTAIAILYSYPERERALKIAEKVAAKLNLSYGLLAAMIGSIK